MNNTINQNLNDAKHMLLSVAKNIVEVTKDGDISLLGVAKATANILREQKLGKSIDIEK